VISVNVPYNTVCGNIVYVVEYDSVDAPVAIGTSSTPLSYDSTSAPNFSLYSDDENLIGEVVPYKMTVKFTDYQQTTASKYESSENISYISPCQHVGEDDNLAYTSFTGTAYTFPHDKYSGNEESIQVSDRFTVTPDFCEETITYACISVTGPDGAGGTKTFTGTEYPNTLCTLDDEDNLKVQAGPNNYVNQDAAFNMPPGTYTYTIEGTTLGGDTVTTTFTWTVIDPCVGQTLTMPALVLSPSEYTINDIAQTNKVLPTVAVAPSVAAPQSLSDFCTLTYTFTVANPVINACLDYSNSPTTKKFDISCD